MVQSVRIGAIEVRNVDAVVKADGAPCGEGLLVGMAVLGKLQITLDGDRLTLAARGRVQSEPGWPLWTLLPALWLLLVVSLAGMRRRRRLPVLRSSRVRFRPGIAFF